jgi:hypothetical protein
MQGYILQPPNCKLFAVLAAEQSTMMNRNAQHDSAAQHWVVGVSKIKMVG